MRLTQDSNNKGSAKMNIVFTELFIKECRDKFQIAEAQVQQAITSPDEQQVAKFDELELQFFVKKMLQTEPEYYLLVCTRWESGNLLVDLAFKILPDLVKEISTLDPIILLQQLVLRFGLTIRVGQQLNKFIFRELIPIELSNEQTKLVEVINPDNHSFMQSMFIKIEQKGDAKIAHCALAYCIDAESVNRQRKWHSFRAKINGHLRGFDLPRKWSQLLLDY